MLKAMKFVFLCILLNENCSVKVKLMETKFIPLFFLQKQKIFLLITTK